ncbi:MAG: 16S/23S rRNA (cytidine-2'-O)-methyltransferase TlyA [Pelotomaculum sp. PtaB.Bin013]|uniref:TlyA family RNA methyltransferase n=1 Tax=Pelotomaculum isophthalicicum JI TaxID=947010 RepID=A0A9X4JVH5_9FIRM|nr:TlyA family RNA methyltransferase [Pelotomaculum isophthalicicum]MDF9407468.1 TlyA family RNA methyltransferase [Pelotomaculum isophthalicicum JI]OPX92004.1 MAG: 16S/23S rRNA (cytidine-2'-O)-methyltransferase TlyA [Pelotomaculum sp. PtaB.Bin013]
MSPIKQRLDVRLVEGGFFPSREKARAAIMAGLVFVDNELVDKPGRTIKQEAEIVVRGEVTPYVSRGGLKLEKAIKAFSLDLTGKVVLDVGASTGGFTDCALKHGARLVYAVDVGYGQLAWSLRNDPRVIVLERTNIRYLAKDILTETPDFTTIDVSFISLAKVLPKVKELIIPEAAGVALIKPQFEAGREKIGKRGVVRDPQVQIEVIQNIAMLVVTLGWSVIGLDFSPVTGPEGNIEYLIYFKKTEKQESEIKDCKVIVERAHAELY